MRVTNRKDPPGTGGWRTWGTFLGVLCAGAAITLVLDASTAVSLLVMGIASVLGAALAMRSERRGGAGLALLLVAVAVGGATVQRTESASASSPKPTMNRSDHRALMQLRRAGHSRLWHPARTQRTRADLRRLARRVLVRMHRAQLASAKKRAKRTRVARSVPNGSVAPRAWQGINLSTNIGCFVGMSMIDEPEHLVFGFQPIRFEAECPDSSRHFGTREDIGMSMSDEGYVNDMAVCQNLVFVAGNDLFYVTGWTGQGVTTVLSVCLNGDVGPVRFGWGGPDRTFAERVEPQLSSAANDELGWTG